MTDSRVYAPARAEARPAPSSMHAAARRAVGWLLALAIAGPVIGFGVNLSLGYLGAALYPTIESVEWLESFFGYAHELFFTVALLVVLRLLARAVPEARTMALTAALLAVAVPIIDLLATVGASYSGPLETLALPVGVVTTALYKAGMVVRAFALRAAAKPLGGNVSMPLIILLGLAHAASLSMIVLRHLWLATGDATHANHLLLLNSYFYFVTLALFVAVPLQLLVTSPSAPRQ